MEIVPFLALREQYRSAIPMRAISTGNESFYKMENRRNNNKVYNKDKYHNASRTGSGQYF